MVAHPAKRARTVASAAPAAAAPQGLFAPFRSLGHITTEVPFVVQARSSKFLETPAMVVVTSLGSSWAMWEGGKLTLLFVGESGFGVCGPSGRVRWIDWGVSSCEGTLGSWDGLSVGWGGARTASMFGVFGHDQRAAIRRLVAPRRSESYLGLQEQS